MSPNLKTFLLTRRTIREPLLGASTKAVWRPEDYSPSTPLTWWYRPEEGEKGWSQVPAEAIEELDSNQKIVMLRLDEFGLAPGCRMLVRPSEGPEAPTESDGELFIIPEETSEHQDPAPANHRPPIIVEGEGTGTPKSAPRGTVSLERSFVPSTSDEILWVVIRNSTSDLGFNHYKRVMDHMFGIHRSERGPKRELEKFTVSDVEAYKVLKEATALFVMRRCGTVGTRELKPNIIEEEARLGHSLDKNLDALWREYLTGEKDDDEVGVLPYLYLIRQKMGLCPARPEFEQLGAYLRRKLTRPCLLELIWAYWMEEAMLVQTFNSITRRFQNLETSGDRDPLGQLETNPLLPLNNFLWGWVQEELDHLTVRRRAHEYDHEYGFTLQGKALGKLRSADRRSKFLESFHNLLWKCTQFYRQDDDTTVKADGFQVLNAIKETHYVLSHGAHNQYGNLPSTARQEMLMQQWILSLPEMREFLGTRAMVPYPEAWMDRVDTVKTLKGWTNTSVVHFRDLAVFGEQLLLSVRWGDWSQCDDPYRAANWARYWRAEVQGYVHGYRAATGVDLTTDVTDPRLAQGRFLPPSVHLRNRLADQASR